MATILIKKRDTTGAPSAGDLTNSAGGAELAVNTADKRLYAKDSGGNVVELGTAPSTVDINAGSIDGTPIGAASASTGAFTTLSSNSTTTLNGTTIPASKTLLVSTDIGTSVQAYDTDTAKYDDTTANFTGTLQNGGSNVVVDTDIGSTVQAYDANTAKYDDTTANFTGTLQNGGSNVLVDTDIGTNVQAYDADTAKYDDVTANFTGTLQNGGSNVVVDTDIGSTVQAYDADTAKYDDTTANFTGTLQNGGSNVLVDTDIGTNVQAYDADTAKYDDVTANFTGTLQNGGSNVVVDSDIGSTVQAYDADTAKYDDTTANFTGTLQNGGSNVLVDTDIGSSVLAYDSNLQGFVTAFTLPTTDGTVDQVLKTDGAGNIGFATVSGGGGTPGGSDTQIQYNSSGSFAGASGLVTDGSNLTLNAQGDLRFADSDSSNWVAFQAPATIASNVTWTLPDADGTDGQVMKTNGSGTLSWITPATGGGGGGTSVTVTQATATASQTDFSVTYTVGQLSVYLNGALLSSSDYTATNGTSVVLASGAASGDIFTALAYSTVTTVSQGNTAVEVSDTGSDGTITFDTDGSERMRISNTGVVGIGTTSPTALGTNTTLDIRGSSGNGGAIRLRGGADTPGTDDGVIYKVEGNTGGMVMRNYANGRIVFMTNNASTMEIQPGGSVSLKGAVDTANGTGITFPATQSASTNANTLDDYEEGTWTVTATCTTSGTITLNGSVNTGRYTKIGNRVLFSFRVDVSSVSSPTGGLRFNLPFTAANPSPAESGRSVVSNFIYNSVGTNISNFTSFIIQNTSQVFVTIGTSTTGSDTAANQMQPNTEIHLAGQYIAA